VIRQRRGNFIEVLGLLDNLEVDAGLFLEPAAVPYRPRPPDGIG
jgi:hypothetical protein